MVVVMLREGHGVWRRSKVVALHGRVLGRFAAVDGEEHIGRMGRVGVCLPGQNWELSSDRVVV